MQNVENQFQKEANSVIIVVKNLQIVEKFALSVEKNLLQTQSSAQIVEQKHKIRWYLCVYLDIEKKDMVNLQ